VSSTAKLRAYSLARKGGSASPKTMAVKSPKARISGGKAAFLSQRVEDNAFHLGKRV